ncbi:MAG: NADPH-dependent FMN reductase [Longimicrobiaceae bacterium]
MHVLAFAGSIRRDSFNRSLIRAVPELAPDGMEVEIWDRVADIPLYNADSDSDQARPGPVTELKEKVADADALLLAVPEYNWGMSGVLKNAIDWVSRPAFKSPLVDKPVAMIGASGGAGGTARAQTQLRDVLASVLAHTMPHPGVQVATARNKFTDGRLADQPTRDFLANFLVAFRDYAARLGD